MNHKDLAEEYRNIKAYCRKESAKSFKHPLAHKETPPHEPSKDQEVDAKRELSDDDLAELMRG